MPRNSIACEPCRARKVKCHPPFPCRKCIDMGMEHACTSRSKARPNRVSQVFSASKQKANLEPQKPSFSNPDLVDGRNTALRVIDQVFSQHFGSLLQSKSSPERRSPQPSPDSNREAFLRRLSTADPPRPALLPTFRTRPIIDHFMQNAKSLVPWMESSYVQSVIQKAWNGQYDGSNIGQAVGPASKERDACAHMIFALGLYFEDINKNYGVAHGQVGDDDYEAQSGKDRDIGTSGSVDRLFDDVVHFCQSLSLSREEEQPSVTGMNTALMQFLYAFFIGCYDFAQEAIFKSFKICVSLQARDTSQNNMAFYGRAFFQVAFSDLVYASVAGRGPIIDASMIQGIYSRLDAVVALDNIFSQPQLRPGSSGTGTRTPNTVQTPGQPFSRAATPVDIEFEDLWKAMQPSLISLTKTFNKVLAFQVGQGIGNWPPRAVMEEGDKLLESWLESHKSLVKGCRTVYKDVPRAQEAIPALDSLCMIHYHWIRLVHRSAGLADTLSPSDRKTCLLACSKSATYILSTYVDVLAASGEGQSSPNAVLSLTQSKRIIMALKILLLGVEERETSVVEGRLYVSPALNILYDSPQAVRDCGDSLRQLDQVASSLGVLSKRPIIGLSRQKAGSSQSSTIALLLSGSSGKQRQKESSDRRPPPPQKRGESSDDTRPTDYSSTTPTPPTSDVASMKRKYNDPRPPPSHSRYATRINVSSSSVTAAAAAISSYDPGHGSNMDGFVAGDHQGYVNKRSPPLLDRHLRRSNSMAPNLPSVSAVASLTFKAETPRVFDRPTPTEGGGMVPPGIGTYRINYSDPLIPTNESVLPQEWLEGLGIFPWSLDPKFNRPQSPT